MNAVSSPHPCLAGGGEAGALLRAVDWARSRLGPVADWPQALCTTVGLMLNSKFPMFIAWGPQLTFLYNDAYAEILGNKHPTAVAGEFAIIWSEIWPAIAPIVSDALAGKASFHDNLQLKVRRHGIDEDAWFTFSYSPILGDQNEIKGMFCACTETTEQVMAARRKVEENKRLQQLFQQLQVAQAELKAANARKDEFLAMLAHELRNPLAPIASAAELLARAPADVQIVQKTSVVISRQIGHMKELLDDLLDVSRVTRGLVTLRHEAVDLEAILQDAVDQARGLINKKNQTLRLFPADQACALVADKTRLVQVFANLLNNAAKYTGDGGTLCLSVSATADAVAVEVSDSGVGISAALLPHIFDLFTQGERASDRTQGGLGLGLSLVKTLVELHGGHVTAHSAGVGLGSSFTVTLPLAQKRSLPEQAATDDARARSRHSLSVLVVDDNTDAADTMGMLLETVGHQVAVCHSAAEALAKARQLAPSVLFLDIGLPLMDGYELAGLLRRMPQTHDACIVALTGYGQREDVKRAVDAGFDAHLVKPVNLASVLDVLEQAALRLQQVGQAPAAGNE